MAFGVTAAASVMMIDIITGATMGIGRAVAESIVAARVKQHGTKNNDDNDSSSSYALFLVGRNVERGQQVADSLNEQLSSTSSSSSSSRVFFEPCNVSDYQHVVDLKQRIAQKLECANFRINCLVNCAVECPKRQVLVQRKTTNGGVETLDQQFATNVLGYHFMTRVFQDHYQDSCIVNVASNWAGSYDLSDLHFKHRPYDNDSAYRQSKQCNRMLTAVWADILNEKCKNTKVNACHPGDPCTKLSTDLGYNLYASPPTKSMIETDGTIPFLCGYNNSNEKLQATGGWLDGGGIIIQQPAPCRFMKMKQQAEQLFDVCERYCAE